MTGGVHSSGLRIQLTSNAISLLLHKCVSLKGIFLHYIRYKIIIICLIQIPSVHWAAGGHELTKQLSFDFGDAVSC